MRKYLLRFTIACVLTVTASNAHATLIDFEAAATEAFCQVSLGGSIDGFTLSPANGPTGAGFNTASACFNIAPTAVSGQKYMLNYNSRYAEFTKDDGTFRLDSVYVHADSRTGPATVRFQGLDGVNGNVLYTLDVGILAAWQQVLFPGWENVKTFTWDSIIPGTSNIAIDNFSYDLSPVPIPGALPLFASVLGLAGLWRWRKRQALDASPAAA